MADAPKSMQQVLGKLGSRKRDADLSNYVFDKLPPQARELEEVVLGGMMLDKDAVAEIIDILKPESFYVEAHQHIFEAIHELFGKSEPVDILTVTEQLRKMGKIAEVGGPFYVTKLTNRVGSTANIEHHARIISERYILRELIKTSNMIIKDAYEETTDVFDLLDKAEQNLFSITEQNLRRSYDTMSNLVQQAIKQLENIKDHQDGVVGVPTGYVGLDRLTSGWQKSDLVIIAARPAMGKTALTLNIARNAAVDFGKGVALFSLEMSSLQLVNRLISSETGISSEKLKKGDLRPDEWVELTTKVDKLAEAPIFIDDTPAINIFELRAKCRRLKMQHDIQLIVIDYLQLMSGGGSDTKSSGNREQEISLISRSLKSIAKELDVPVIALSQLSRAVETRGGDKRPQLSDLRECITGDSLIYLPRTRTYKKVKDLVGKQNFDVLSLDENLKLQRAKCLDVWETGKKKVYEVTTSSGFKIKASANHPFLTVEGWKKLEELKEGDCLATAREITIPAHTKGSSLKNEEIILLAHMLGDGCYAPRQPIHYTSQDPNSLEIVANCAKNLWGIEPRVVDDRNSKTCQHVYIPSPYQLTHNRHHPFVKLLHKLGMKKGRSYEKTIPREIFKCNERQLALFISHLWSTDGCVHIRTKTRGSSLLLYSSNSYELIMGLKQLLLRFGIQSAIRKGQKGNYRINYMLTISNKVNILKYAEKIGVFGVKADTLNKLVEITNQKTHNPNTDIIPKILWKTIKVTRKNKGFTERTFQKALGMQYCGTALYKSNISRNRLSKVSSILEDENLRKYAESDVKWEKIKAIKYVGIEPTYDLHVEKHHNFLSNNFIVHNSGAIEQDADIVAFIYRPEYYGLDQDEDGNPTKGVTELIVAKHRNGALDTVKLRFIPQFTKFEDFSSLDQSFDGLAPLGEIITRESRMNDGDVGRNDEPLPF